MALIVKCILLDLFHTVSEERQRFTAEAFGEKAQRIVGQK